MDRFNYRSGGFIGPQNADFVLVHGRLQVPLRRYFYRLLFGRVQMELMKFLPQ